MPDPIIGVLFERGAFSAAATTATAGALIAYSIGLPAYVLIKVLAPGFFAREDTATPVKIAAFCVVVNIVASVALMGPMLHVGVALATAISAWVNAGLLAWMLWRRGHLVIDSRLRAKLPRIALASVGMAAVLLAGVQSLSPMLDGTPAVRAMALAILVLAGLFGYTGLALATKAAAIAELRQMMRRQRA